MWGGRYSALMYSCTSLLFVNFNMLIASGPSQPFTILKAALKNKKHQTKKKVYMS